MTLFDRVMQGRGSRALSHIFSGAAVSGGQPGRPPRRRLSLLASIPVLACTAAAAQSVQTSGEIIPSIPVNPSPNWVVGDIIVGDSNLGWIEIRGGGSLRSEHAVIGNQTGVLGNILISGTGSDWTNDPSINPDHATVIGGGGFGLVTIENGASATMEGVSIGRDAGSIGSLAVHGAGSVWSPEGILRVGVAGEGSVSVGNQATVNSTSQQLAVGELAGSTGRVTITGAGTQWNSTGEVHVGWEGDGILSIADGAVMNVRHAGTAGLYAGSTGQILVSGAGSTWTIQATGSTSGIQIGVAGTGSLVIHDGGQVFSANAVIGRFGGATGTAMIYGAGSKWTNVHAPGTFDVGRDGTGHLSIEDGGMLETGNAYIGKNVGSSGSVLVTGGGSNWRAAGDLPLFVGHQGNGTLVVEDGGSVDATAGLDVGLGGNSVGATGFMRVSNAGSTVTVGDTFVVGSAWGTGALIVEDGALIVSGRSFIGSNSGTGSVLVTGSGTRWTIGEGFQSESLTVGNAGSVGTLDIADGGFVSARANVVIGFSNSPLNRITVDGAGSTLDVGGVLGLGGNPFYGPSNGSGRLDIANGGTVLAAGGVLLADHALSSARLNIGAAADAPAAAPGTLVTGLVTFGDGDGRIVFNHTGDAYDFAVPVTGPGTVQTLAGTTVFGAAGAMSYSGRTLVDGGVLRAGAADAFSLASEHVVGPAGTLDLAGHAQTLSGLINAGLVKLNGASAGNTLTVTGNYVGNDGIIALNTVLGSDGSPSDRLVIDGGTATGSTGLRIVKAGGDGELTTASGILVVQATNGGTTAPGAFSLSQRVAAGAYEYHLFRGGAADDPAAGDDWFLRSTEVWEPPVDPGFPPTLPDEEILPLYRPEVALYVPVPAVARQMGLAMLGTLHERVGEEENIRDLAASGYFANGAWVRAFGQRMSSRWEGTVDARSDDANLVGVQAGLDLFRRQSEDGHRDHAGLYLAYSDYTGRISGFSEGVHGARVGRLELDGPALGIYWTHFGPAGWYVDAIVQVSWFDAKATSLYGPRLSTSGTGFAASLEAGYPIRLAGGWQIEPQAQVIYQSVSVDGAQDDYSSVSWDGGDAVTGRIGARLQHTGRDGATLWQPYGKVNLWHGASGTDRARFDDDGVDSRFGGTAIEVGGGVTAKIGTMTSLYAHVDQTWHLGGGRERTNITQGAVGIRINW